MSYLTNYCELKKQTQEKIRSLKLKIDKLNLELEGLIFRNKLFEWAEKGPIIIRMDKQICKLSEAYSSICNDIQLIKNVRNNNDEYHYNSSIDYYRIIESNEPIKFKDEGIMFVPITIQLNCIYPSWSKSLSNIKFLPFCPYEILKDREILVSSIASGLNWSLSRVETLIDKYLLNVPQIYNSDLYYFKNIDIDYDSAELLKNDPLLFSIYSTISDDNNMMFTSCHVRYILVTPLNLTLL